MQLVQELKLALIIIGSICDYLVTLNQGKVCGG
jgi:hypothetical protein